MTVASQKQEIALFILAHNDDEFFALPAIEAEVASGRRVVCIYTTDGFAYGEDPTRRLKESRSVLCPRGVSEEDVIPLGMKIGVRDGVSFRTMTELWDVLVATSADWRIDRVYLLAWEGGHADHDAGHLLGVALAKLKGIEAYEFSLYNSYQTVGPFFRCMTLIPAAGEVKSISISLKSAIDWILSARHYASQWRTFVGLLGFCIPQILVKRELQLRRVSSRDYRCSPHDGTLLYEKRFKVPHQEFLGATSRFITDYIGDFSPQRFVDT